MITVYWRHGSIL